MATTTLYRFYNKGGELLYVGISLNYVKRLKDHQGQKWIDEAVDLKMQKFKTRDEAIAAELLAIIKENPLHNIQHNDSGYDQPTEQYSERDEQAPSPSEFHGQEVKHVTTPMFARRFGVKPDTVRHNLCINGHFMGVKPLKLPNGRLLWPNIDADNASLAM